MANETTATTYSSRILSEILSASVIPAHTPKHVVMPLCAQDSIDGEPSLTKKYPKFSDIGKASAGTEGTDLSTNTTLSMGTAISVTPTEGALIKSTVTTRAARRKYPGASGDGLYEALRTGNMASVVGYLRDEATRLMLACMETAEFDCAALLGSLSTSVGTTGTVNTVANMINAIYQLEILDPWHDQRAFVLTPQQLKDLRLELGSTGGGLGGSVWTNVGDTSFFNESNDVSRNGAKGAFLGIPVYQYAKNVRTTINSGADEPGALISVSNDPVQSTFVFCEGEPFRFDVQVDASLRAVELVAVYEYAAAEIDDSSGILITSVA